MTRSLRYTVCLPLLLLPLSLVFAQDANLDLGAIETYESRKVGSEPPMIKAVIDGDLDRVRTLALRQRMNLFERDRQQRSILMVAVLHQKITIVDFLLQQKADIRAVDNVHNTALHYAALDGNAELVRRLLQGGALLDAQNLNGETSFMMAIKSEDFATIKVLIDAGANHDLVDYTAHAAIDYVRQLKNRGLQRKLRKLGLG